MEEEVTTQSEIAMPRRSAPAPARHSVTLWLLFAFSFVTTPIRTIDSNEHLSPKEFSNGRQHGSRIAALSSCCEGRHA
jgi:hypothetical protein